jgi:methionine-rich copper-binding protein CopC
MGRILLSRIDGGAFILGAWLSFAGLAWGHTFPTHQRPGAGSVLVASPPFVQIWFDGEIEPVFSTISVEDAGGHEIAKGAVAPGQPDATLLQAPLPPLVPGIYQVKWSVVARDGHHTEGQYTFIIKRAP